jgi:hypothetical protein
VFRLDGPIPAGGVQIGVTDTAGFHLDQYFAGTRLRDRHILDCQGFAEISNHGSFHRRHLSAPWLEHQTSVDPLLTFDQRQNRDWGVQGMVERGNSP